MLRGFGMVYAGGTAVELLLHGYTHGTLPLQKKPEDQTTLRKIEGSVEA